MQQSIVRSLRELGVTIVIVDGQGGAITARSNKEMVSLLILTIHEIFLKYHGLFYLFLS